MVETPTTVRAKIEAAKVAVMDMQQNGPLGSQSLALSVDVMNDLDKAWLSCCRMQRARDIGL